MKLVTYADENGTESIGAFAGEDKEGDALIPGSR
jgi:hypothetical protein